MIEVVSGRKREIGEKLTKTVGVIVFDGKGSVLTVRHGRGARQKEGIFGVPGGHLEEGESYQEAAVRELQEETGLETQPDSLVEFPGNYFRARIGLNGSQEFASWTIYIATNTQGELKEEEDASSPEWVSVKDLNLKYETLPNVLIAVDNASRFVNENH